MRDSITHIVATFRIDENAHAGHGTKKTRHITVKGQGTESEILCELRRYMKGQYDPDAETIVLLDYHERNN